MGGVSKRIQKRRKENENRKVCRLTRKFLIHLVNLETGEKITGWTKNISDKSICALFKQEDLDEFMSQLRQEYKYFVTQDNVHIVLVITTKGRLFDGYVHEIRDNGEVILILNPPHNLRSILIESITGEELV